MPGALIVIVIAISLLALTRYYPLIAVYALVDLMPLKWALVCAAAVWCLPATLLLILWMKFHADAAASVQ
ncbi:MAG: hypothetical protein ABI167_04595 [Nitrosospira sp.]